MTTMFGNTRCVMSAAPLALSSPSHFSGSLCTLSFGRAVHLSGGHLEPCVRLSACVRAESAKGAGSQPQLGAWHSHLSHVLLARRAFRSLPMSIAGVEVDDPRMPLTDADMQYDEPDLVENIGPEVDQTKPYVHANTGWITRADAHTFVHGRNDTNHSSPTTS